MPLYAATIFLSAFLLFQVQPLIARIILPWFGGSSAVWATCMLFFQLVLLLGYLYAHCLIRWAPAAKQPLIHSVALALSLALLPIAPSGSWQPAGGDDPTIRILGLLGATVGVPYLLLSTTGPLLQAWYSRRNQGATPYRLFALSNLGSMLALLSYPPLVEPFLPVRLQATGWSWAYGVFALLCVATAWRGRDADSAVEQVEATAGGSAPGAVDYLLFGLLPACASILLLAVTNYLTQDVASIPFLWILPLSLYLLSFILSFDAAGWYRRIIFLPLLPVGLGGMTYLLREGTSEMHLGAVIAIFSGGFFVAAMVCHGELARRKPHPSYLTGFFLMVSIGGAAGGLFVGVVAPYLFRAYFELPLGIGACGILVAILIATDPSTWFGRSRYGFLAPTIAVAVLCGFLTSVIRETTSGYRLMVRNFYGGLRVSDEGGADDRNAKRKLIHGVINHGMQLLAPDRRREPASYYCTGSGVAVAIVHRLPEVPQRVGVIGLGAGSLAAYGRAKDVIRYYEINPLVVTVARSEFTYLGDTPAMVEIALGDARLSLEREQSQQFDVLAVDAFSSDSIPVHLLTREAFDLYFRHLRADGILAVHISNKHLDLKPVVERVATAVNIPARVVDTDDDEEHCFGSTWVLLTRRAGFFESLGERKLETLTARAGFRPWTDDFSNLYQILK